MADIVERLKVCARFDPDQEEAARLIVEMRAEIERLRAALQKIAAHDLQAVALDALRPGERIRAANDKTEGQK